MPLKLRQANFQGGVDGLGDISATIGILLSDKCHRRRNIGCEGREFGKVFVAVGIPVEDRAGEDGAFRLHKGNLVKDEPEVALQEGDFIGHRAGCINYESNVHVVTE